MSISTIVTQGFGSFGSVNLVPTLGFGVSAAVEQDNGLLGGKAYSYQSPYDRLREEEYQKKKLAEKYAQLKRAEQELKEAEAERKRQIAKAQRLKTERALAKLAAEELATLQEIDRLRMERAWLIRLIDEEEAILVILMTLPFVA